MISGYIDFEFDLPEALLAKLIEAFASIDSAPLMARNIKPIPEAQGVYQLFLGKKLVYVGKTDADAGLKKRLIRHCHKIQHRSNDTFLGSSFRRVGRQQNSQAR
ncbi:MAG TPA: hypothetical protein VH595_02715 [Verrucomicrobiae bacterium]|jgi:hypothetical protein|nr:hypothetical protein [Verrucomicrobiae bacterium]